jgi:hypothetical protein
MKFAGRTPGGARMAVLIILSCGLEFPWFLSENFVLKFSLLEFTAE